MTKVPNDALADPGSFVAYRNICAIAKKTGRADIIQIRDGLRRQIVERGAYYNPDAEAEARKTRTDEMIKQAAKESLLDRGLA